MSTLCPLYDPKFGSLFIMAAGALYTLDGFMWPFCLGIAAMQLEKTLWQDASCFHLQSTELYALRKPPPKTDLKNCQCSFPFGIWSRVGFWIQEVSSKSAWIYKEWIRWKWLTDVILKGSGYQPKTWSKDSQVIHKWQPATNIWGIVKLSEALTRASQSAPECASKVLSPTAPGNSISNSAITGHFYAFLGIFLIKDLGIRYDCMTCL